MKCNIIVKMHRLIEFFPEYSAPVVVRIWTDAVIRRPLLGSHVFQAALALLDDVQPVGTSDEAESFFQGQKTVEDVTGLIQNRVQLYLSEEL